MSRKTTPWYDRRLERIDSVKIELEALYEHCVLCPRRCGVDRDKGKPGFCGQGAVMKAAWAGLHFGEEPVITGRGGSGVIFFSGCTLKCSFCQNSQLSKDSLGAEISISRLAGLMMRLQEEGAENINLVTGTHFIPGIIEAAGRARGSGLKIPLVWNSSGYETVETVRFLSRAVDIFLFDAKTLDQDLSRRLLGAADYPDRVRKALPAALKTLHLERDLIRQGVIVRHLVLPGRLDSTRQVLEWFKRELSGRALLSVMFQFIPPNALGNSSGPVSRPMAGSPEGPGRRREYERVVSWLDELEIEEGFIQEPEDSSSWLPDFNRLNPFPDGCARLLWHWKDRTNSGGRSKPGGS